MKDYKKILEGVVNIINTTEKSDIGFANICSYIGDNFPELAESEDERIRKELIFYFQKEIPQCSIQEHADKMKEFIAWLEKQGEHADFRNKIQIGDKVTRNEDGVLVNLSQLNRFAKKYGEQKPVEPQQDMLSQKQYAKVVDECIYGEQKPAWSEEDDENLNLTLGVIDACSKGSILVVKYDEIYNWLKSLRPQSTWKPSEEQMERLKGTINSLPHQEVLYSLYQDLKKLRDE